MSDATGKCSECGEVLFGGDRCHMSRHQTPRPLHQAPPEKADDWAYPDESPGGIEPRREKK